jgi:hypothetical protein
VEYGCRFPPAKLVLIEAQQKQLLAISRPRGTPRGIALRIRIVLGPAEDWPIEFLLGSYPLRYPRCCCGGSGMKVMAWRGCSKNAREVARPKRISGEQEVTIVEATMKMTRNDATHWSALHGSEPVGQSGDGYSGSGRSTKLQPHRVESFKFSVDPEFAPKVRDIMGLYINPPYKVLVLSVDEQSPDSGTRPDTADPFRFGQACPRGKHTITNGTEQRPCSPHECSRRNYR